MYPHLSRARGLDQTSIDWYVLGMAYPESLRDPYPGSPAARPDIRETHERRLLEGELHRFARVVGSRVAPGTVDLSPLSLESAKRLRALFAQATKQLAENQRVIEQLSANQNLRRR